MKKLLVIMLLSLTLMVTACTPKDKDVAQGVTDTTITIGNTAVTEGFLAFVGAPFNDGLKAYLKRVNDAGGVDGRTIEFIHYNDNFVAAEGIAATEKLIDDDKVFALVGHFGTPTVGSTLGMIRDRGIPMVYAATGIADLYRDAAEEEHRVIFPVQPYYQKEGEWMVAKTKELFPEATRIGVFYTDDEAGQNLFFGAMAQALRMGITLVTQQTALSSGAIAPAAQVTAMKNANVDVIIAAMNQGPFLTLAGELANQDVAKPVVTSYVSSNLNVTTALKGPTGSVGNKFDVYAGAWVDITGDNEAAYEQFVADMTAFGKPELVLNAFAMAGWIAAFFFVEGLSRVEGALTWENFVTAMESAPFENPLGGTIDYSDGKRLGALEMSMLKSDPTAPLGWVGVLPLSGISG